MKFLLSLAALLLAIIPAVVSLDEKTITVAVDITTLITVTCKFQVS